MQGVCLTPIAGAQGEFAGVAMIRAYHDARGDTARKEILVPDAAHGTNLANAVMCGYTMRERFVRTKPVISTWRLCEPPSERRPRV